MVRLFEDLNVGDNIYWVFIDKWNKINVEEYTIFDIRRNSNGRINVCVKYQESNWELSLKNIGCSHQREDGSYFVMDDGIKWAVRKLKERQISEFTKQIDEIRKKMTDVILDDYIFKKVSKK